MLWNRSRAVTSKQALMADHTSMLSPTKNPSTPISSFLGSPRFFNGFLSKNLLDPEMSPTSILESKNSANFVNPFAINRNLPKPSTPSPEINIPCHKLETEAIGLAIIDSINEVKIDGNVSKPVNRMALFGSKLKVQIPDITPPSSFSPAESPESPADYGIKTRNSQPFSPIQATPSKDLAKQLSLKEMELSEDYTCVIIRGPNPKTTHIFDDCIVERCIGEVSNIPHHEEMECVFDEANDPNSSPVNFLSFCHTCNDRLDQGKDIYMYRGEKAFCSDECRFQGMLFEGMKNQELDNAF